jgi:hypothetical protein
MADTSLIDWRLVLSLGIPAVVAVAGWFLAHWLTSRRDVVVRKREARVKALEVAYLRLANSSHRSFGATEITALELFVSEIQLYGTPRQIAMMQSLVEAAKKGGYIPFDQLLIDLRDTIRSELRLERVEGDVWWLRFNSGQPTSIGVSGDSPNTSLERTREG